MQDYKKLYFLLFNGISDTIESLKALQTRAEAMVIADEANEP